MQKGFKRSAISFISIVSLVLIQVSLIGCGNSNSSSSGNLNTIDNSTEKEPIELKMVSGLPPNTINSALAKNFSDIANEKGEGKIKINYVGGPDVVPSSELAEAVKKGSVDITVAPGNYLHSVVPEAEALTYSDYNFEEEKENGAYDYLNDLFEEKGNMHLLDVERGQLEYNILLKKEIDSLDDLEGYRLRVAPAQTPLAKELDAKIVDIGIPEVYSALERGIVDGVAFVDAGLTDLGLHEQITQIVRPSFAKGDYTIAVNKDVWDEIPEDVQKSLFEWAREAGEQFKTDVEEKRKEEKKEMDKAGIEDIDVGDEIRDVADKAGWSHIKETSPDHYEKLKELFTRD